MKAFLMRLSMGLVQLFLIISMAHAQSHPFLIVEKSQYAELQARASVSPWKEMKADAISEINNASYDVYRWSFRSKYRGSIIIYSYFICRSSNRQMNDRSGSMDEVKIYNRALTAQEISDDYNLAPVGINKNIK